MTLWKLHLWAYALGFPVYFGAKNYSVLAAFIWLGFVAIGAVVAGWRPNPATGVLKSTATGLIFAAVVIFPAFYLGRWLSL